MHSITSLVSKKSMSRLALLAAGTITALYLLQKEAINDNKRNQQIKNLFNLKNDNKIYDPQYDYNISCHYVLKGDALRSAESINPPPNSIFFHETSCRGGLNSRQACAIESAARIHPNRNIYVYFNSPISEYILKNTWLSIFTRFKNINLARLHVDEYTKGTPLDKMFLHRKTNESYWPIQHTADMLRFVTLHKYGGVYLDTDLLVVKPLDALGKNWAARQSNLTVNIAAMAFSLAGVGHNLSRIILEDIRKMYRPDLWDHNGSGALMRSLLKLCNISSPFENEILEMSAATCHGFEVYDNKLIYPIPWKQYQKYFMKDVQLPETILNRAYSHHLWNMMSQDQEVDMNSPFEKLARKYCPTIRKLFGDRFGS